MPSPKKTFREEWNEATTGRRVTTILVLVALVIVVILLLPRAFDFGRTAMH